jgi:hypothetical protein
MDGLAGLDAIAAVQSRIAAIEAHFNPRPASAASGSSASSAGSAVGGNADFASALASAQSTLSGLTGTDASSGAATGVAGLAGLTGAATSSGTLDPSIAAALQNAGIDVSGLSGAATTAGAGSATGTAYGDMRSTPVRKQFAADLLTTLGMPQTSENVRAIVAWATAENTAAGFNPLATTRTAPNTTNFNSVGVKNYHSYADGVAATAATLRNGLYTNILSALARGDSAASVAQAVANSKWGTGTGVLRVLASGTV